MKRRIIDYAIILAMLLFMAGVMFVGFLNAAALFKYVFMR